MENVELVASGLNKKICEILEPKFVEYEKIADVLAMGLARNRNVWLYGDGGFGKSDMVATAFKELGLMKDTFIQVFGQGMTTEKLCGNIDLKELNVNNKFRYNIDESFMKYKYAIFEEMPDAAIPVLFLLKHMLEQGEFCDGSQRVKLRNKCIVVCSNKGPKEVAEYGVDAEALTQRFPFTLNVTWDNFEAPKYLRMLEKRMNIFKHTPSVGLGILQRLALIFEEVSNRGKKIVPRIAIAALEACMAMAQINNRPAVEFTDIPNALKFIEDIKHLGEEIIETISKKEEHNRLRNAFDKEYDLIIQIHNAVPDNIPNIDQALTNLRALKQANKQLTELKATDDRVEKRAVLLDSIQNKLHKVTGALINLC